MINQSVSDESVGTKPRKGSDSSRPCGVGASSVKVLRLDISDRIAMAVRVGIQG